jgi:hypothetical membrane protein
MSVSRSWAPGCGISRRAMTRVPGGQSPSSSSPGKSVTSAPSRGYPSLLWAGVQACSGSPVIGSAMSWLACQPTENSAGALAFAVGLHRGVRRSRAGVVGPALLFVSGIGLLLAAIFPLREDAAGLTYDPGGHAVAGVMFFLSSAVGLIAVSRRLAGDPRWRHIATYTLGAGLVALAGFVVMGVLAIPDDAPLHDWAGLAQRVVILVVLFPTRIVLSLQLLKVARGQQ